MTPIVIPFPSTGNTLPLSSINLNDSLTISVVCVASPCDTASPVFPLANAFLMDGYAGLAKFTTHG